MKRFTMLFSLLAWLLLAGFSAVTAQETPYIGSFEEFTQALNAARGDPAALNALWDRLVAGGQVPFIAGDTVVFLYRGQAESVAWRGDFSGWTYLPDVQGKRFEDSDLWLAVQHFPLDARLEYKVVIDGQYPILDPANPRQQGGGIEIKSVIAMPDYVFSPYMAPRQDVTPGTFSPYYMMISQNLGYSVMYRVYTPAGYDAMSDLPVIYVTDGQDYTAPSMGDMVTILDNVIGDGLIKPVIAVFIDPRDPNDLGKNRRGDELTENPAYAAFVAEELVPLIDRTYKTNTSRNTRAILGASWGGWNAIYFGLMYPDVFGLIGAQSPVFLEGATVGQIIEEKGLPKSKYFVCSGRPEFSDADASFTEPILQANNVDYKLILVNEGHSYGQWSGLLDDLLVYFFGA